ncbi:hypothetical protein HOLleu_42083 [Holothuria leucospilota]|uniref:Uncharacterized protein n=1 Tax=Holothuria leucospilota TaxID=206669 RepID=A0A9Q0YB80_HOLLE|nr:hypothetical protein HOLleu_42083 [Holothuria leucospilota]
MYSCLQSLPPKWQLPNSFVNLNLVIPPTQPEPQWINITQTDATACLPRFDISDLDTTRERTNPRRVRESDKDSFKKNVSVNLSSHEGYLIPEDDTRRSFLGDIDEIKEAIRQMCSEGVIISGYDSLLLQRSSMQLLEIAAKNSGYIILFFPSSYIFAVCIRCFLTICHATTSQRKLFSKLVCMVETRAFCQIRGGSFWFSRRGKCPLVPPPDAHGVCIPIKYVSLSNCLQSVNLSTAAIRTTSGLALTSRIPVEALAIYLYNRDMTEDEAIDILQFASMCPSLRHLSYYGCVPPRSFNVGPTLSTLKSRNVTVMAYVGHGWNDHSEDVTTATRCTINAELSGGSIPKIFGALRANCLRLRRKRIPGSNFWPSLTGAMAPVAPLPLDPPVAGEE